MSWMSEKTGRPKEEDGHKRINISIDKFTDEALDKIRKGGNVSKFIENELRPTLRKLDPSDVSFHVWRIEVYLSQQIINAIEARAREETAPLRKQWRKGNDSPSLFIYQTNIM